MDCLAQHWECRDGGCRALNLAQRGQLNDHHGILGHAEALTEGAEVLDESHRVVNSGGPDVTESEEPRVGLLVPLGPCTRWTIATGQR